MLARKLSFKPEIKINENGDTYIMPIDAETLNGYDGYVNVDLSSAETLNDILEVIYTLEEKYIFALYDLSHFISDGVSCTIIISVNEMKVIDWKNNIIYTGEYNSATSVETWFSNANATRYVEVGSGSIGQFLYIANNGAYSFKNIAISDITNLQTTINNLGNKIVLEWYNASLYQLVAKLYHGNTLLSTSEVIDLPLESVVVDGRYDNATKSLILTLDNGNEITIPVGDLVSGLVSTDDLATALSSYYTKVEIDNLLNDKQDKSNLTTTIDSATPSNTKYPSEKAVVDYVDNITNEESVDVSDNILIKISGISDNLALPPESQMEVNDIEGNSVVVNQLYASKTTETITIGGLPVNVSGYTFTMNAGTGIENDVVPLNNINVINGHKYLVVGCFCQFYVGGNWQSNLNSPENQENWDTQLIFSPNANGILRMGVYVRVGVTYSTKTHICYCIDLTQWFDNDIPQDILDTPSNFFKHYKGSLVFDTGHIENGSGNLVDTNKNVWDEEWEVLYGANLTNKNLIEVIPNETYYFRITSLGVNTITLQYFDDNNNLLSTGTIVGGNTTFTIPNNATQLKFILSSAYGTTYKHDICINVSDPKLNGTYVAHIENTLKFGNDTLRSAGSVRDKKTPDGTITRNVGYVDLGSLTWAYDSTYGFFYTQDLRYLRARKTDNIRTTKYSYYLSTNITQDSDMLNAPNMCITTNGATGVYVYIKDTSYTDVTTFTNSLSDVYAVYELATPTTEQGTPYDNHLPVYYGGEEFTTGDVPFVINKNYDISIKDQVITNVRVDKQQSEQIHALENTDKSLQEQIDNIEEEFNESSVDTTDTKIIKVSGLDDNLAIPEESQVEISKVVCGALARNQLAKSSVASTTDQNVTYTNNNDGTYTVNGTPTLASSTLEISPATILNHTYFYCLFGATNAVLEILGYTATRKNQPTILLNNLSTNAFAIRVPANQTANNERVRPLIVDLTITHGPTIANYLASLSNDNAIAWLRANDPNIFKYREYGNALVNTNGDLITTNRNVWNGVSTQNSINSTTGEPTASTTRCLTDFIEVIPSRTFYFRVNKDSQNLYEIHQFDINKEHLSLVRYPNANYYSLQLESTTKYLRILLRYTDNRTTMPSDWVDSLMVNVDDTSFNGQYVLHKQETQTLPSGYGIPKLVDNKLSFDGDEIIGDKFNSKYDIVDLGTLNWYYNATYGFYAQISDLKNAGASICSKYVTSTIAYDGLSDKELTTNSAGLGGTLIIVKDSAYLDVATFKTAMSGVMLVFEKAQPTQSTITPIHPMSCYKGGYELQSSDVPYTLTRNYDISIKDQVKTNVEVDREQSNAIKSLNQNVLALQDIIFTITNTAIDGYTNIGQITLDNDTLYIWKKD